MTGEALSSIAHLSDVENSEEPDEDNENSRMSILYAMEGTDISGAPLVQNGSAAKGGGVVHVAKSSLLNVL